MNFLEEIKNDIKGVFSHHADQLDTRMHRIESHLAAIATHEADPHDLITQQQSVNLGVINTFQTVNMPVCPKGVTWLYAAICIAAVGGTGTITAQAYLDSVNGPPIGFGSGVGGALISFPSDSGWVTDGRQLVINLASSVVGAHSIGAQAKQIYQEEQPYTARDGGN